MTFTSGILICTYNGVPERWFISVVYSLQKTCTSSSCLLDMEHFHHIRATYPVDKELKWYRISGLLFIHKRLWVVERSKYVLFEGDIIISLINFIQSTVYFRSLHTTLIPLLRISIFCHFGSTSFVLPIRPKYHTLNRVIRVL